MQGVVDLPSEWVTPQCPATTYNNAGSSDEIMSMPLSALMSTAHSCIRAEVEPACSGRESTVEGSLKPTVKLQTFTCNWNIFAIFIREGVQSTYKTSMVIW